MRLFLVVAASASLIACSSTSEPSTLRTYTGTYTVDVVESTVTTSLTGGGTFSCTNSYTLSGVVTFKIDEAGGESSAAVDGTQKETGHSTAATCQAKGDLTTKVSSMLTVAGGNVRFDWQNVVPNGAYSVTNKTSFSGTLANGVITGTLTFSVSGSGVLGGTSSVTQNYSTSVNVVLH